MYAEKIENGAAALGVLAGQIPEAAWQVVKLVQDNLLVQARAVRDLEEALLVPDDIGGEEPALMCPDGSEELIVAGLFPGEAVPFSVCENSGCEHISDCWRIV